MYMFASIYVRIHVCLYVRMHACICMHVCMLIRVNRGSIQHVGTGYQYGYVYRMRMAEL